MCTQECGSKPVRSDEQKLCRIPPGQSRPGSVSLVHSFNTGSLFYLVQQIPWLYGFGRIVIHSSFKASVFISLRFASCYTFRPKVSPFMPGICICSMTTLKGSFSEQNCILLALSKTMMIFNPTTQSRVNPAHFFWRKKPFLLVASSSLNSWEFNKKGGSNHV